jgi:hypothetical protein
MFEVMWNSAFGKVMKAKVGDDILSYVEND